MLEWSAFSDAEFPEHGGSKALEFQHLKRPTISPDPDLTVKHRALRIKLDQDSNGKEERTKQYKPYEGYEYVKTAL